MVWIGQSHPLETLAEWGAPVVLAMAAGWSARIAGLPLTSIAACGVAALAVGVVAMRLAGQVRAGGEAAFEPAGFQTEGSDDVLLLENVLDELLLDDPLVASPDSRVVRLSDRHQPTPGELVLRISHYLTDETRAEPADAAAAEQQYPDATSALHAALANIRASLR